MRITAAYSVGVLFTLLLKINNNHNNQIQSVIFLIGWEYFFFISIHFCVFVSDPSLS